MIKQIKKNGFYKTYSDKGFYIINVETKQKFEIAFNKQQLEYVEDSEKIPLPKTKEEIEEEERLGKIEDEKNRKEYEEQLKKIQEESNVV
jgi:hypothetical protein